MSIGLICGPVPAGLSETSQPQAAATWPVFCPPHTQARSYLRTFACAILAGSHPIPYPLTTGSFWSFRSQYLRKTFPELPTASHSLLLKPCSSTLSCYVFLIALIALKNHLGCLLTG